MDVIRFHSDSLLFFFLLPRYVHRKFQIPISSQFVNEEEAKKERKFTETNKTRKHNFQLKFKEKAGRSAKNRTKSNASNARCRKQKEQIVEKKNNKEKVNVYKRRE